MPSPHFEKSGYVRPGPLPALKNAFKLVQTSSGLVHGMVMLQLISGQRPSCVVI